MAATLRRLAAVRRPSTRIERTLLLVAAVAMLWVCVATIRAGHVDASELRWGPLLLAALVGVPLTALTNGLEYAVTARAADVRVPLLAAMRTTVLATAANLLPLPGGPLVRIQALRAEGLAAAVSTQITAAAGASWVAVAALLATVGGGLMGARWTVVAPLLALASVTGAIAVMLLMRVTRGTGRGATVAGWLVVVEVSSVVISAGRLYLILLAIGQTATAGAALVLALAGVLAMAVGIVPAGLGVREALSALLAVGIALPAAVGFLVSVVDRIIGLLVVAPLTVLLTLTARGEQQR